MALTERKKRFAQEYAVDLNGTAAAIRAGYSEHSAKFRASKNLADPAVQAYVQQLQSARANRCEISADRVLQEYAKIAFLDPRSFFDDLGSLKDIASLPADTAAALAGMDVATERVGEDAEGKPRYSQVRKIRFCDKRAALDSVARCLGMFKDKVEVSFAQGLAERVIRAKERVNGKS